MSTLRFPQRRTTVDTRISALQLRTSTGALASGGHRTAARVPLTTDDPASELALKLKTITRALRMAGLDDAASGPQVVAALIQASAMAGLAEAVRSAAADIGAGLDEVAAAMDQA